MYVPLHAGGEMCRNYVLSVMHLWEHGKLHSLKNIFFSPEGTLGILWESLQGVESTHCCPTLSAHLCLFDS